MVEKTLMEVFASRVSRSMLDARSDHKVPDGTSSAGRPRTGISPSGSRMVDAVISSRTVGDLRSNCRVHHVSRSAEKARIIHGNICVHGQKKREQYAKRLRSPPLQQRCGDAVELHGPIR